MKTYIGLLRGINVSGQKLIKMTDLKAMLLRMGFEDVVTYIQSGNVVFKTQEISCEILANHIHENIEKTFGFDVPVLVKTKKELIRIFENTPFNKTEDLQANRVYYVFLKNEPDIELVNSFKEEEYLHEQFVVATDCVYLLCSNGYGKSKLNNNLIERKLKVSATARNYKTMKKLIALA